MRIDLHTHSSVSDGTQTPTELVRAAARAGLDVVALTDHDTAAGWDEAEVAALEIGITLVEGMEISTRHGGTGVHLLAYLPDATYPELVAMLGRIVDGRDERLPEMLRRLDGAGRPVTIQDVRAVASDGAVLGRPHVADALVAAGHVASRDEAFATLLGEGCPAFVDRYAEPLADAIGIVRRAGGASVVAHPWGRGGAEVLTHDVFAELAAVGLSGIEVDHQDHRDLPQGRERLRAIAAELELVVTGSSDHHGTGKVDHELGCHTTAPEQYADLVSRAAAASAASGRATPGVVCSRLDPTTARP